MEPRLPTVIARRDVPSASGEWSDAPGDHGEGSSRPTALYRQSSDRSSGNCPVPLGSNPQPSVGTEYNHAPSNDIHEILVCQRVSLLPRTSSYTYGWFTKGDRNTNGL